MTLEEKAEEYAEKHAFRVPYDGSNKFYDDVDFKTSKEGYLAGAKDLKKENADLKTERKKLCDVFEEMKAGLESQIATLGERCNQLLKDKGDLTDRNRQLETIILGNQEEIVKLEQQIEKMKCCGNCKHFDKLYNRCELTRLTLKSCLCSSLDKWEIKK